MRQLGEGRVWIWLFAGPLLFLLAIVGVSIWLGATGVPSERIGEEAPRFAPQILFGVLLVLGLLALLRLPMAEIWAPTRPGQAWADLAIGAVVGAALAAAYLLALEPLMTVLQSRFGDYVPPGAVRETVSGQVVLFFLANVMLAPWVEETLYRGLALQRLRPRFGAGGAVVLSCLTFGLLHWMGGFWYMALTATIAGGAFAALALWRGNLLAPFAAHLTLNLIEFGASWT